MVPESHWQFKKCGCCHKRPQESTEGTCWVHFLGLSHLDPLLSLCLCSGSVRKVNHRHLAADPRFPLCFEQSPFPSINPEPRYFMSTRLIKDGDLYCCGTTIKGNSRNRVLFPVTARLRCYSYFSLENMATSNDEWRRKINTGQWLKSIFMQPNFPRDRIQCVG